MVHRFPHERSHQDLPRSTAAIFITCPRCNGQHRRSLLLRRVRRHIEQLRSPVRVTLATICPHCRAPLTARVRVARAGSVTEPVHAAVRTP